MECNKDEAHRAMGIAERKFREKDLNGAKKFALKAQTLFPLLDGLSHFITALNVHIMAQSTVAGEKDWYAIMSLSPSADESTVKKQYRLLALQLHPDKNHATGAEGAFKLVQEAFNVLKDNNKRNMYDQKRKTQAANGHKKGSAGVSPSNGFKKQDKGAGCDMRSKSQPQGTSQKATRPVPQPSPSTAGSNAQSGPQKATRQVPTPTKPRTARCSKKHASQTAAQPVLQPQNQNTTSCSAQGMAQNAARMGPQPFEPCTEQQTAPQTATRQVPRPPKPRTASCSEKHASQAAAQPVLQPQNRNTTSCSAQGMAPNAAWVGPQPFEPWRKQHMHRATSHSLVQDTFWTRCTSCNMWFEYNLIFKKHCLYCRCCRAPFYAIDAGLPVIGYKIEEFQAWMDSNLASALGSNGSSTPNHGSSENVSAGAGCQEGTRPCKRMRGEESSNANGAS